MPLWRQGDVLIKTVDKLPQEARTRSGTTLVRGEATGHSHRISDREAAEVFEAQGQLYVRVIAPSALIVHEEHGTIELPKGEYLVWQQREYSPERIRRIRD